MGRTFLFAVMAFIGLTGEEKVLLDYFLKNRTEQGMVLDRQSDKNTVSVAATGFGMSAWAIAVEHGVMTSDEAVGRVNASLDFVEKTNPAENKGWLFHFVDPAGKPVMNKEVSTIDTALFYLGAQQAAEKLQNVPLKERVARMIEAIDEEWLMRDGHFLHGLVWSDGKPVFFDSRWDCYSEGVLIYRLLDKQFTPRETAYDLPLFVYYYPLCFYEDQHYEAILCRAIEYQIKTFGACGITACDGPHGYSVGDPMLVSPLSIWAASVYCNEAKKALSSCVHPRATGSYHRESGWVSEDVIGIDVGSTLIIVNRHNQGG